jgi:rare lipoprotein A
MNDQYDFDPSDELPVDIRSWIINLLVLSIIIGCGIWLKTHQPKTFSPTQLSPMQQAWAAIDTARPNMRCNATWYASPEHGRPTASGELFDSTALTCAIYPGFRKYAPYGSMLLVRNQMNGRLVLVLVNDAMPVKWARQGKMLDLSKAAAESLGIVHQGVAPVEAWRVP